MMCLRCKSSMREGHSRNFLGPQGLMVVANWQCLNCGHAVDFIDRALHLQAVSEVQCSSGPGNRKRPLIPGLCFLMVAAVNLFGCASGEQVLADRTERQKLEQAYMEVQETLKKQAAA